MLVLSLGVFSAKADPIDLSDMAVGGDGSGSAIIGTGLDIVTGQLVGPAAFGGSTHHNSSFFRATDGSGGSANLPYVDGVFLPKGLSQIDTAGGVFYFPGTGGWRFDAIRHGAAVFDRDSNPPALVPIRLDDQPGVNRGGLGLHSNQGITFDLDAIRNAGHSFDAVTGVAGENFDTGALRPLEIWVLVDGQERFSHTFHIGGDYLPFTIDLTPSDRFLTFACTDYDGVNSSDHGVIADLSLIPEPASLVCLLAGLVLIRRR
jgi:hypothetical protein